MTQENINDLTLSVNQLSQQKYHYQYTYISFRLLLVLNFFRC